MIKIKEINVLAVNDPAISVYVNSQIGILKEYQKTNNINVNFEIVSYNRYFEELISSFKKYKYDIVMIAGHLWLKEFVEKNYLSELKLNMTDKYNYFDILPEIRNELELNNKKYLLPSFCDGHILVYRESDKTKNINNKITIKELINVVKKFNKSSKPLVLKADISEIFLDMLPYFRAKGLEPFSKNGEFLLNNEWGINAFHDYLEMKKYSPKNVKSFGNKEVKNSIQKRDCELAITWSGQLGSVINENCLDKQSLNFAYLERPWKTTWSFALNNLSEKKEIAENFMYYITSKKIDKIVGKYSGNPTRLSNFKEGKEKYGWYKTVLKMLNNSESLPNLKNTSKLMNICSNEFHKAFIENISVKKAFSNIKKLLRGEKNE